jgi:predicted nucleotidyltransferase
MTGIWEFDVGKIHETLRVAAEEELEGHEVSFEELVVFGSYGRGVATASSDLDLLLVVSVGGRLTDTERRDLFEGVATSLDTKDIDLPDPIEQVDFLVSTYSNRDKVLRDCLEEVSENELENAECLVYSLTDKKKRDVLYP